MGVRRWLTEREIGNALPRSRRCVATGRIASQLLSKSITCYEKWDPDVKQHGGIFNLAFSPNGSLLAAACERKAILLLDPNNVKLVASNAEGHTDCVNYVRFLDSRMFVSCSDDTTVRLWDVRFMRHCVRTLAGHFKWVKNIEYVSELGLLVTSGFDGSVHTWDFNSYSEENVSYRRVFQTSGLMRMKLSPDATRMILATSDGFLMVIHNLDLNTLPSDLAGFKPNFYRLLQLDEVARPPRNEDLSHVFSQRRNRVELITDFPCNDNAEMIASLEVHPQGWCAVSRNSCNDESSEWTCVHDIQGTHDGEIIKAKSTDCETQSNKNETETNTLPRNGNGTKCTINRRNGELPQSDYVDIIPAVTKSDGHPTAAPPPISSSSRRLLYFIREPNVGRGFIKEMSFSKDGRLLASPFAYGVRLLAFDDTCSELCDCVGVGHAPRQLNEVACSMSHSAIVATTQFSPTHPQLATGCLDGSIGFHRPVL